MTDMEKLRQREIQILDVLKRSKFASIKDIAKETGVSEMTVRRALLRLEQDKLVRLIHGGAFVDSGTTRVDGEPSYSLVVEESLQTEEKRRIGERAASLIEPDDVVVIDSGTTTEYLARAIPDNIHITIVCYTLNILFEVYKRKSCRIIFAGGYYHDNTMMFESLEGRQLIKKLRATKSFLGATGISDKLGVTCSNACEPDVKRAAVDSSLKRVLLADSSKFELVRPYYFADLGEFDVIVTDKNIPSRYEKLIKELGKTLIIA